MATEINYIVYKTKCDICHDYCQSITLSGIMIRGSVCTTDEMINYTLIDSGWTLDESMTICPYCNGNKQKT